MMNAILSLQKVPDAQMKLILQAVIRQDREEVEKIATSAGVEPQQFEFLIIAECANRWLTTQT